MTDPRDYKLELSSASSGEPQTSSHAPRPYLSIHFACCNVYQRIYRNAEGTAYTGHCPRCALPVRFPIGQGGTSSRFFRVC
jgi:hypothetical protein